MIIIPPPRNVGRENDAFWVEIKCWNCRQVTCDVGDAGVTFNQSESYVQAEGESETHVVHL